MAVTCDGCYKEHWASSEGYEDWEVRDIARYDGWLFKSGFVWCPECKDDEEEEDDN
jgi:hypothetical protein